MTTIEAFDLAELIRQRDRYRAERNIARDCVDRDGVTIERLVAVHNRQVEQIAALEADLASARAAAARHGLKASKAEVKLLELAEQIRAAYPAWELFAKGGRNG